MVYEAIEPFGDRRGDIQAGIVSSVLANIHRGKDARPYNITDFLPQFETPERRQQTPEEQLDFMLMLQKRQNAGQA